MHNLLTTPTFRTRLSDDEKAVLTLPELLAALSANEVKSLTALRAHQQHPMHAFCVQLAAMAARRAGLRGLTEDPSAWREMLTELAGSSEPWDLLSDDAFSPAFMQAPIPNAVADDDYKRILRTPGAIDLLMTSRNHDIKVNQGWNAGPDDWIYALISVQTSSGYPGSGQYPVSRISGGYGYRNAISIVPVGRAGAAFRRDVLTLAERRSRALAEHPMTDDGVALVWTLPWSGAKDDKIALSDLDPYYIEICRRLRLRLRADDGSIYATRATSKDRRIDAKDRAGVVGDPWSPINSKKSSSLSMYGDSDFGCRRMAMYLTSEDYTVPMLLQPTEEERRSPQGLEIYARGMVRGQGKTNGYHERRVPLTRALAAALADPAERLRLGELAAERIAEIRYVARALRSGLRLYTSPPRPGSDPMDIPKAATALERRLNATVDAGFFDALSAESDAGAEDARDLRAAWMTSDVIGPARELLEEGLRTLPVATARAFKARSDARSLFEGMLRSQKSAVLYAFEIKERKDDDQTTKRAGRRAAD